MLISPEHKFIFFKPLKCAGSSVEYTLLENCGEDALCTGGTEEESRQGYTSRNNEFYENRELKTRFHSHTWPDLFLERIANPSAWKDFKKVSIVRNPWDSVVSWYWWTVSEQIVGDSLLIKEEDSKFQMQFKFETFLNLVSVHDSIRPESLKERATPLDYLSKHNEQFVDDSIDFFIRFEKLQSSFNDACDYLGLKNRQLARFKTKQRKIKRHYTEYYNSVSKSAVEMRFPETIRKFNYKF